MDAHVLAQPPSSAIILLEIYRCNVTDPGVWYVYASVEGKNVSRVGNGRMGHMTAASSPTKTEEL